MTTTTRTALFTVAVGLALLAALILAFGGSVWDNLGQDTARLLAP